MVVPLAMSIAVYTATDDSVSTLNMHFLHQWPYLWYGLQCVDQAAREQYVSITVRVVAAVWNSLGRVQVHVFDERESTPTKFRRLENFPAKLLSKLDQNAEFDAAGVSDEQDRFDKAFVNVQQHPVTQRIEIYLFSSSANSLPLMSRCTTVVYY